MEKGIPTSMLDEFHHEDQRYKDMIMSRASYLPADEMPGFTEADRAKMDNKIVNDFSTRPPIPVPHLDRPLAVSQ